MTPEELAKGDTEHAHQRALFSYCTAAHRHGWAIADSWSELGNLAFAVKSGEACPVPALEWFHAIPNGGSRGDSQRSRMIRGGQLKAEGVKSGVADTFLPWPVVHRIDSKGHPVYWHGLYIEMKKPSQRPKRSGRGGMSDEQIAFKMYSTSVGYGFVTCYSWIEAAQVLRDYINYKIQE